MKNTLLELKKEINFTDFYKAEHIRKTHNKAGLANSLASFLTQEQLIHLGAKSPVRKDIEKWLLKRTKNELINLLLDFRKLSRQLKEIEDDKLWEKEKEEILKKHGVIK